MSRSPLNPNQLQSVGSQDALAPLPPPAPQNPSTHSWDPLCGSLPWGLSCLLALQHVLVMASLLCVSHLLLLCSLSPGGLSYSPSQLLASSFFSCGVSTILQTWMGSRLPLVQAPSLEFLISGLVLTSQKLPLAMQTPGNSSLMMHLCRGPSCHGLRHWNTSLQEVSGAVVVSGLLQGTMGLLGSPGRVFPHCGPLVLAPSLVVAGLSAHREVAQFCSAHWGLALLVILLMVVCSQHLGSSQFHVCPWRRASASSTHTPLPAFRLLSVCVGLGRAVEVRRAGLECSLHPLPFGFCLTLQGWLRRFWGRSSFLSLAAQVLIPVACVWIVSAFLGFSVIPQELSAPTKAPWIWLPHPGEWNWPLLTPRALAAGISMALAASTSSLGCYALCGRLLHLPPPPPHACSRGLSLEGLGSVLAGLLGSPMGTASSFPNVGKVGLIQAGSQQVAHLVGLLCMGLGLSPRLAQLLTTIPLPVVGWSPLDVLLHSLLTQPIFLAGLSGFLLENTIPGTQLERGLGQGLPSVFTAQEARMPQKPREKAAQVYRLPFPIQNLCPCIPQPLRCLCPLPEDPGDEEGGSSEPEEMADLLPGSGEPCPESSREGFRSQK
ncbi:PREDICTED: solute carrier family 23 member 3 isoform X3 [Cercocebus atys]|uniref:solute carrier family 23 member 3 isoform X3 n=1 Tax=Cercocebus atys TaxID=9531 RepID=UPI0005F40069|nr:PREDICTED: solute carrier family 23 member 3 isoform X3 [Cercocebus atys]